MSLNNFHLKGVQTLVTGAGGFIGSHLVKKLVSMGSSVTALVRPSTNLWRLKGTLKDINLIPIDLGHSQELSERLSKVQIIYHLAASGITSEPKDPMGIIRDNVMGTLELLTLAKKNIIQRFIYCGSCFEYESGVERSEKMLPFPLSEYAASKSAGWLLANAFHRRYGLPVVTIRPFTVYGPYENQVRLIPYVIMRILEGLNIEVTRGDQSRDFLFIEDLIEALLYITVVPEAIGDTFNICTGISTSIQDVVQKIVRIMNGKVELKFGALPIRQTEIGKLSGDPSHTLEKLGWKTKVPLEEGLYSTIQWFKENRFQYPKEK